MAKGVKEHCTIPVEFPDVETMDKEGPGTENSLRRLEAHPVDNATCNNCVCGMSPSIFSKMAAECNSPDYILGIVTPSRGDRNGRPEMGVRWNASTCNNCPTNVPINTP